MRFQFEGKTFVIEFQRKIEPVEGRQPRRYTTARLNEIQSILGGEIVVPVRGYTVVCYHKDKFTYEAGRKAALSAALYDAPTKGGGAPLIGTPLSKEFRTAVWKAYHER